MRLQADTRLAVSLALALCAWPVSGGAQAISSLPDLLDRLAQIKGLSAHYHEEKRISLLKRPLLSQGRIDFAAPNLLLRRVESPEVATLLLSGDVLHIADASGKRRVDLKASPVVQNLVLTFVYVLSGDQKSLDRLYSLHFEPSAEGTWRLQLTPKTADLKRLIKHATLEGHGAIVEQMTLVEKNNDSTLLRFSEVDLRVQRDARERERLFRLP